MATNERTVTLKLVGDDAALQRVFSRTQRGADETTRRVEASGRRLVSIGRSATVGITLPVVAGFFKATQAASGLNEQVDATGKIFGNNASAILAWSKTAATSFGTSQRAALQATVGFGNMLQTAGLAADESGRMGMRLVELSADMASFSDADPTDMLERLRSGLAGEAEPLRRFGVFLSENVVKLKAVELGLVKQNEELTEAQKVQARYAVILEQTANQHGNFADTAESVANQSRSVAAVAEDAAASFGQVLQPAAKALLTAFAALGGTIAGLPGPLKAVVAGLLGVAAVGGPVLLAVGKIKLMRLELQALQRDAAAASGATATATAAAAASAGRMGTAVSLAGRGLKGLGIASAIAVGLELLDSAMDKLGDQFDRWRRGAPAISKVQQALLDLADGAGDASKVLEAARIGDSLALDDLKGAPGIFESVTRAVRDLASVVPTGGDNTLQDAAKHVDDLDKALASLVGGGHAEEAQAAFARINDELLHLAPDEVATLFDEYSEALGVAGVQTRLAERDSNKLGATVEATGSKVRRFAGMTGKEFKSWRASVAESMHPVTAALDRLGDKSKLTVDKIVNAFERSRNNLKDYNENFEAVQRRGVPDQVLQQIVEMGEEGADVLAVLADANKRDFRRIVDAMRGARREHQDYIELLDQLQARIDALDGRVARVKVEVVSPDFIGPLAPNQVRGEGPRRSHGGERVAGPSSREELRIVQGGEVIRNAAQERELQSRLAFAGGAAPDVATLAAAIAVALGPAVRELVAALDGARVEMDREPVGRLVLADLRRRVHRQSKVAR